MSFELDNPHGVYAMGNGRLCAYGSGGDIIQLFGAPYSAPSVGTLTLLDRDTYTVDSVRVRPSAVWKHAVLQNGEQIAELTEFVDSKHACFIRRIAARKPMSFVFQAEPKIVAAENSAYFPEASGALLLTTPASAYIYNDYPMQHEVVNQLVVRGCCAVEKAGTHRLILSIQEGITDIIFCGSLQYNECILAAEEVLSTPFEEILSRTEAYWSQFKGRRAAVEEKVAASPHPELLDVIDDVAVLIKSQQSAEGGVLAGYNYHLAYVRDIFGVSRCFLALGYLEEAKQILRFYYDIFKRYGFIKNAQAMGVYGAFHEHENDEVEITGYLIIQAFQYVEASGDTAFLDEIAPMLKWAFRAQMRNLKHDMLPFNGDETYIAGGVLPRYVMYDGSAEATLLFLTGGALMHRKGMLSEQEVSVLEQVKAAYRSNFFRDGSIVTNVPERMDPQEYPRFRMGICEDCCRHGWTEKNGGDRYLCPDCLDKSTIGARQEKRFELQSVSLVPLFIGSDLFTTEELSQMVCRIMQNYQETGRFPSSPSSDVTVGYDYGLLLYSLTKLGMMEEAGDIYRKTIEKLDEYGAWVEYYIGNRPYNTRCRPWESGINLSACVDYVIKTAACRSGNASCAQD